MSPENAIEVRNVTKYFKVYSDKGKMLRERITSISRNKYEKREVLKGISFDVKKGEAVGLIGKNGCGKSTTLKLLTKILRPNSGSIETRGRVCSLIELGAGFHPDMSGRENIYINASIFGIKAKEVDKRLEDIIAFSELEDYIDNPVRTYSSGMYMRLAFSVAINVEADILLVDEILAVGDNAFQKKCFNKLKDLKRKGTTIVIVSHALGQVEEICDRAVWINQGLIRKEGPARQVCKEYLTLSDAERIERERKEYLRQIRQLESKEVITEEERDRLRKLRMNYSVQDVSPLASIDARRNGSGKGVFTYVNLTDKDGETCQKFKPYDDLCVHMQSEAENEFRQQGCYYKVHIIKSDGVYCYGSMHHFDQYSDKAMLTFKRVPLLPGSYYLDFELIGQNLELYDGITGFIPFTIESKDYPNKFGVVMTEDSWSE